MKIINLGSHKTGTTSITKAMENLGFKIAPEEMWYGKYLLMDKIQNSNIINNYFIHHNNKSKYVVESDYFNSSGHVKFEFAENPFTNNDCKKCLKIVLTNLKNDENIYSFGVSFRPIWLSSESIKCKITLKCNYPIKIYDGHKWINYSNNCIDEIIEIKNMYQWRIFISNEILKNIQTDEISFEIEELNLTLLKQNEDLLNLIKCNDYEFYEDFPYNFNDFYKIFNENIENVKFILSIRDPEKWFNSFIRHEKRYNLNNKYGYSINYTYGKLILLENKKYLIDRYNKRNQDIIDYFEGTDKLLILNIDDKDNYSKIINFFNLKNKEMFLNAEFPTCNIGIC